MAGPPLIEIREWGRPARRLVLSRPIVVGRDCTGANLADERVSRQHLRLVPSPTALSVVDLGSRNGTTVNGVTLTRRVALVPGDVVRLGRSEIIVLHTPTVDPALLEMEHDATRLAHMAVAAPPPPPGRASRSRALTLAERVLGIDAGGERQLFPSYTELTTKVPLRVWQAIRVASIAGLLALIAVMFVRPAAGLFAFFEVIVPLLPILFLVAPGLWRNVCPLAASNQLPRVLGFTRGRAAPNWLRNRGYLIAVTLFVGIAGARLAGLDRSGAAMGIVLGAALAAAIAGGFLFKGKSGWCSSICPLLPLQRVYGQTPFVTVPNSHCTTCVGCAKNCYDFKPRAAYQADLADSDPGWSGPRKLFVAALPGFVLGFFTLTSQADIPTPQRFSSVGALRVGQHRVVLRGRGDVTVESRDAHGDIRRGGAEHLLLVHRPSPGRRVDGDHRSRRAMAAVADQRHGRSSDAAVDRPDQGQRTAVRGDHRERGRSRSCSGRLRGAKLSTRAPRGCASTPTATPSPPKWE